MTKSNSFRVILTSPTLELNGVNVFSINLVRGLQKKGISAFILLTEPHRKEQIPLDVPEEISIKQLPVNKGATWKQKWKVLIEYLEDCAPCVYIPNYDMKHSCISAKLSHKIGIVGIVHSDDQRHYDHATRLGKYWNAIVTVSQFTTQKTIELNPILSHKIIQIPYGVSIPDSLPDKRSFNKTSPIKLVYAGKIRQVQKRVFDLPKIMEALEESKTPFEIQIIGDGPAKNDLVNLSEEFINKKVAIFKGLLSNELTQKHLEESEVILLTSEYEGLPNIILEAMARGCVPIVTDIKSGVSQLIQDGYNGCLIPVGDIQEFANRITFLQNNPEYLNQLKTNAFKTVAGSQYGIEFMVNSYLNLFNTIMENNSKNYTRKQNIFLPLQILNTIITSKDKLRKILKKIK